MKNMSLKLTPFALSLFAQVAFSQTPSIDAIVSPADYTAGPASPGGVVVIFGSNLASVKNAPAAPFPVTVSGVTVKIGSSQAPLAYVSPNQINAVIPWDVEAGKTSVIVTLNGAASSPKDLTIAPTSPSLFYAVSSATRSASVRKGEYLTIYCVGLGDVSNRPPSGGYPDTATLAETKTAVQVFVGGLAVPPTFAGIAPPGIVGANLPGLYQIDIQVPTEAAVGAGIPIFVRIGGVQSNTINVAIQAADSTQIISKWTQLGPDGPFARVITGQSVCPDIAIDGASKPMQQRAAPTAPFYPVLSCEAAIPATAKSASINGSALPLPKADVKRIGIIGDTGCRIDATRSQACNDPVLWPAATVAASIAASKPDVILQLGDAHYREAICPASNPGCAGSPWGYNWAVWNADVFAPLSPLFSAAPIIMIRGNHESCSRAGEGWLRFFDPRPMPKTCPLYTDPYTVQAGPTQIFVIDSAEATDTAAAPALVAKLTPYFDQLAKVATSNTWVVMHHPIWGFDNAGTRNLSLQTASQNKLPAGVQLVLAGHIHTFQTLTFAPARAPQMIAGNSGDFLQDYPTTIDNFNGMTIGGATVVDSNMYRDFGFTTMDWNGTAWAATARTPDGTAFMNCTIANAAIQCAKP